MNGLRLLELARPSVLMSPAKVVAATTAVNSLWIDVANCGKLGIMILGGINGTNAGGSLVVTLNQGFDSGTGTTTLSKAFTGAAAFSKADICQNSSQDSWTQTTGLTGTLTIAPTGNGSVQACIALIEIDPSAMDVNATSQFNKLQVVVTGGSVGALATVIAFQKFPRVSSRDAAPTNGLASQ